MKKLEMDSVTKNDLSRNSSMMQENEEIAMRIVLMRCHKMTCARKSVW